MKKVSIYLSGSIRGKDAHEVIRMFHDTKLYIEEECEKSDIHATVYSPVRGKQVCEQKGTWEPNYTLKEVIARDEADIRKSDVLLILTGDNVSDGTWLEFGLAHYECKIPVLMVAPKRKSGEIPMSWSGEKVTFMGDTLEDCVKWLIDYWMV